VASSVRSIRKQREIFMVKSIRTVVLGQTESTIVMRSVFQTSAIEFSSWTLGRCATIVTHSSQLLLALSDAPARIAAAL